MMITRGVRSVVERHGLMTIVGFSIRGMATTNRMFSFLLCSKAVAIFLAAFGIVRCGV
jgi:hypothetical protein